MTVIFGWLIINLMTQRCIAEKPLATGILSNLHDKIHSVTIGAYRK